MEAKTAEAHLLLIDDDVELCDLTSQYLSSRGFHVDTDQSGEDGLARIGAGSYDLIVLDVMLPGIDGFDVLRQIRATHAALPVVMLTAHGDEIDRIVGLELGADDYLPKPFNPRELLARIRAVLRRASENAARGLAENFTAAPTKVDPNKMKVDDMEVDIAARSVLIGGEPVGLTATEYDLVAVLAKEAGKVVSREDLSRQALGRRLLPLDRSLDLHMSKLRRKLGLSESGGERIRTLRGVGFILIREQPLS